MCSGRKLVIDEGHDTHTCGVFLGWWCTCAENSFVKNGKVISLICAGQRPIVDDECSRFEDDEGQVLSLFTSAAASMGVGLFNSFVIPSLAFRRFPNLDLAGISVLQSFLFPTSRLKFNM